MTMRHRCLRLAACLAAVSALHIPAARRTRALLTPMRHGRAATPARPSIRPPSRRGMLRSILRPWKLPGHVAGRLNPALADWTSAHLIASPTQKLLAGVSADQNAADRITVVGGLVNVLLTLVKLAAGIFGQSAAMISDAAHSASDLASDVVTLVAMRAARLPADDDHPYGHGRFETVGALVVGGMLVATGAGAASHALESGMHVHAHGLGARPGKVALVAALVSIVAKEVLFRATIRVGKRVRSPVLEANAWHHRSDAFSSVVALVGIAAARCSFPFFRHADAAAGLAVAAMLAATGFRIAAGALTELSDAVDHDDLEMLKFRVLAVPGVAQVVSLRGRTIAGKLRVDVDVVPLDGDLSTSASFQLAEAARIALLDMEAEETHASHSHSHGHSDEGPPRVGDAMVRVVPAEKTCPVVASLPTQADLERRVEQALTAAPAVAALKTHVRYPNGLSCELDVYLAPTAATGEGVGDLRAAGAGALKLLDEAALGATVANVFWSLDARKAPAAPV